MSRTIRGMIIRNRKPKARKRVLRPKNESAYKNCKMALKKFDKKTNKKNYSNFQTALTRLSVVNPTMAGFFKKLFKQLLFDKALKKEDFE